MILFHCFSRAKKFIQTGDPSLNMLVFLMRLVSCQSPRLEDHIFPANVYFQRIHAFRRCRKSVATSSGFENTPHQELRDSLSMAEENEMYVTKAKNLRM
jgi:hypothetical protein